MPRYSLKPGRGPSLLSGMGGIFAAVFGGIWIFGAASIGAPPFFLLFGVVFILFALTIAIYGFYNASRKDRMSVLDVTEGGEEPDPLARALGHEEGEERDCPHCDEPVGSDFTFCPKCGKTIGGRRG